MVADFGGEERAVPFSSAGRLADFSADGHQGWEDTKVAAVPSRLAIQELRAVLLMTRQLCA